MSLNSLFGIQIIESQWAVTEEKEMVHGVYADWRERQARNFNRPSTGKWEPLEGDWEITVEKPAIFLIGDKALVHPQQLTVLRNMHWRNNAPHQT